MQNNPVKYFSNIGALKENNRYWRQKFMIMNTYKNSASYVFKTQHQIDVESHKNENLQNFNCRV